MCDVMMAGCYRDGFALASGLSAAMPTVIKIAGGEMVRDVYWRCFVGDD